MLGRLVGACDDACDYLPYTRAASLTVAQSGPAKNVMEQVSITLALIHKNRSTTVISYGTVHYAAHGGSNF